MEVKSQRLKGRDDALSGSLNQAIDALDLARDEMSMKPAKDLFCSASNLLTTIRVCSLSVPFLDRWLMYTGIDGQ